MAIPLNKRILNYIQANPQCLSDKIQRTFCISREEANQLLYSLEAQQFIERTSSNPPLWSIYTKPLYSQKKVSSLSLSVDSISRSKSSPSMYHSTNSPNLNSMSSEEYGKPLSFLNTIAYRYSLTLQFDDISSNEEEWRSVAYLRDPSDATRGIQASGGSFSSQSVARYSACLQLIQKITQLHQLPFYSLACDFLNSLSNNTTSTSLDSSFSPTYQPYTPSPSLAHSLPNYQYSPSNDILHGNNDVMCVGDTYPEEEGAFLEFKGTNGKNYEYTSFKNAFNQCVWENSCGFINLHAYENTNIVKQAKIIFGIHDLGTIQGVRIIISKDKTKDELKRQIKDELGRIIVNKANNFAQPKEISSHVSVDIQEVFMKSYFPDNEFRILVTVTISIPHFPTICSYNDIFYYRQPNAGSISRMSINQIHRRFTLEGFRFV